MSKLASVFLAITISFLLFVGMTILIKPKDLDIEVTKPGPPVVITIKEVDEDPKIKTRIFPKPVIEPKPERVTTVADTSKPTSKPPLFTKVAFKPEKSILAISGITTGGGNSDGDAQPTVRINPAYPPDAARDEIEGYVTFNFDISELGRPINLSVVKSKPRGVFEKQARKALRKWKYKPKMVDEKAVVQTNQTVTLVFKFEKESELL